MWSRDGRSGAAERQEGSRLAGRAVSLAGRAVIRELVAPRTPPSPDP